GFHEPDRLLPDFIGRSGPGRFPSLPWCFPLSYGPIQFNPDFTMKTFIPSSVFLVFTLALTIHSARAGDSVAGTWKGEFDSQIGLQKYTFLLKVDGDKITGKAIGEREMGTNEVVITEGKMGTNEIFFVEPLKFQDNEIRIEYTG